MIKPDDIPPELQAKCFRHTRGEGPAQRRSIAEILNAAIETGVVSPPVRVLRSRLGSLDKTYLFIDDNEAQSHASPGDSSEHYRGQTE